MKYIQLSISIKPIDENTTDIFSYHLGTIGYDSFLVDKESLLAYIPQSDFSESRLDVLFRELTAEIAFLSDVDVSYNYELLEDKNWNKEWEKNYFSPLVVQDECLVRSTFHTVDEHYKYEILIDPKMAFGTGHHATTYLMLQETLKLDMKNKTVLDIGCGTAVLAILASMMGAREIKAIDIDEWAYNNAKENVLLNNISNVDVELGEMNLVKGQKFDYILANINRNILLQNIQHYAEAMNENATLVMSGFYPSDVSILKDECIKNNLSYTKHTQKGDWVAMVCTKRADEL